MSTARTVMKPQQPAQMGYAFEREFFLGSPEVLAEKGFARPPLKEPIRLTDPPTSSKKATLMS